MVDPMICKLGDITQEFNDRGHHRLLLNGKPVTRWAGYTSFTYYKGYVGYSAFYGNKEGIATAAAFCEKVGVGR